MKKILALSAFIFALGHVIVCPVFARQADEGKDEICYSKGIADGGYIVTFDASEKSARLEEQTFAGPRLLAYLPCEKLITELRADSLNNTLVCQGDGDGLMLRKFVGGLAGEHFVSVRYARWVNGGWVEKEVGSWGRLGCDRR